MTFTVPPSMKVSSGSVRFFIPDNATRARNLRNKLELRKAELSANIANGLAQDWPDYKLRVGEIRGISEAIDLCIQAEKDEG